MAELESEDSSDGMLVIDEPNYDCKNVEISDNSNSDVEVVELDEDTKDISTLMKPSSSSTITGLTCNHCFKKFSTNNNLLNHIRKFKGSCGKSTNNNFTFKRTSVDLIHEHLIKKKPKLYPVIEPAISEDVPLCNEMIPIMYKPTAEPTNIMPSLRQVLVDEIEPEYPCSKCGQIFRHNIGLLCHLSSDHNDVSSNQVMNVKKKSSTKLGGKKRITRKNSVKDKKQIENNEPVSNTIDLTMLPDIKKDSLLSRMKSYVYTANKNKVICLLCNVQFTNIKKALAHVQDKHISKKIECGYCDMKFVYELKLRSHMAKRHNIICVYKCDKCSKMINRDECELHLENCEEKESPIEIKREEDDNLIVQN